MDNLKEFSQAYYVMEEYHKLSELTEDEKELQKILIKAVRKWKEMKKEKKK